MSDNGIFDHITSAEQTQSICNPPTQAVQDCNGSNETKKERNDERNAAEIQVIFR
jgi:hypothetical protein